ncbi:MAG TPA: metallopeptidase family protein [Rhodospirillaceae bacterium]|nr:metallopeptidase family protein [Rhodospirillaceae bacterium]
MPLHRRHGTPPSLAELEELAGRELARIPWELRRHLNQLVIQMAEFPDEETEEALDLDSSFDLLGLYCGVAMTDQSLMDVHTQSDLIFLYRRPILDFWCESSLDLAAVIRHVLIHEIGHHFGFSDEDMERIENE